MTLWKATISYDGTAFHGWQVQPGQVTIQGTVAETIHEICGERVVPQGSGRTDTGVHALGQVASFELKAGIPAENLLRAMNRKLPGSIRVMKLEEAPPGFHARHSAVRKTYEYRILPRMGFEETICPPMLAPYVWVCPYRLDVAAMNEAAAGVVGRHDFMSFAAVDPDERERKTGEVRSNCRTIFGSGWEMDPGAAMLRYRVTGSGFLHHMVRNLVGTFVEAGAGRMAAGAIGQVLAARDRRAAGPTAPARGLFLVEVEY